MTDMFEPRTNASDLRPLFQLEQEIPAGHIFQLPEGRTPIPQLAQFPRQPAAAPGRVVTDQLPDCLDVIFGYIGYPEFSFCFHVFILHVLQR